MVQAQKAYWSELRYSTLVRFICSETITKWRHNLFLTVYVNGRDQQSVVIRQRVTHAIQSPVSGEWILPKNFFYQWKYSGGPNMFPFHGENQWNL